MTCFELDRRKHAQRGVTALAVVEELDGLEDGVASSTRVRRLGRSRSSTCIRAPERLDDGVIEQSPTEPMEGSRPESIARRVKAQEVNSLG